MNALQSIESMGFTTNVSQLHLPLTPSSSSSSLPPFVLALSRYDNTLYAATGGGDDGCAEIWI